MTQQFKSTFMKHVVQKTDQITLGNLKLTLSTTALNDITTNSAVC